MRKTRATDLHREDAPRRRRTSAASRAKLQRVAFTESPFTPDQREACASAYLDQGIRPAARVVALAAAGALKLGDEILPAFQPPESGIRDWARREKDRRAGRLKTDAEARPVGDVVGDLRRRLANLAESEVTALERAAKGRKPLDLVRLRKAIGCVRELAALAPGPGAPAPPGKGPKDQRTSGETRTGLAAAILQDHAATPGALAATTPTPGGETTPRTRGGDAGSGQSEASNATHAHDAEQSDTDAHAPGSWAAAEIAGVTVGGEMGAGRG